MNKGWVNSVPFGVITAMILKLGGSWSGVRNSGGMGKAKPLTL